MRKVKNLQKTKELLTHAKVAPREKLTLCKNIFVEKRLRAF